MSRFYGKIYGKASTPATREGTPESGLVTYCASYAGAIQCSAYIDENGTDCVCVVMTKWQGTGQQPDVVLYDGPIGRYDPKS